MLRRRQKSERMQEDISDAGEGIICLPPPVMIDQKRIGDVTTLASDDWRLSVHLSVRT